ncbi:MAG: ABC-2 transporter permease [Treponema sp.]|nr:ABC-2 transporter permease [Treponema sp.]
MNRILAATKLDFHSSVSGLRTAVLAFLIPVVIGAAVQNPSITMVFVMVFATYLAGFVFSVQEKNHMDKLYGILPLKKTEMIAGRYLYALIIGIVCILIALVLSVLINVFFRLKFDPFSFWVIFALAFLYYGFAAGVSFPVYLKFSFTKAYVFTMIPIYIVLFVVVLLLKTKGFTDHLGRVIDFFTSNIYLVPVIGIIGGIVFLTASAMISNVIYTRKEF